MTKARSLQDLTRPVAWPRLPKPSQISPDEGMGVPRTLGGKQGHMTGQIKAGWASHGHSAIHDRYNQLDLMLKYAFDSVQHLCSFKYLLKSPRRTPCNRIADICFEPRASISAPKSDPLKGSSLKLGTSQGHRDQLTNMRMGKLAKTKIGEFTPQKAKQLEKTG